MLICVSRRLACGIARRKSDEGAMKTARPDFVDVKVGGEQTVSKKEVGTLGVRTPMSAASYGRQGAEAGRQP